MEDDRWIMFKFDNAWEVIIEILCVLWIIILDIFTSEWDFEFMINKIVLWFYVSCIAVWLRFILRIIICSDKECIKLYDDYLVIYESNYLFKIVERRVEYVDIEKITIINDVFNSISIKVKNQKKQSSMVLSKQSIKDMKNILIEKWLPVKENVKWNY